MNIVSINFSKLTLAWIFIQVIFISMVVGGGLLLYLDFPMSEQHSQIVGIFLTLVGIIFWSLFMYTRYFFKRHNLNYQEFFKKTDVAIVRSFHKFSYYLLAAFPLNAVLFVLEIPDVTLIQINAMLALPFCLWSLAIALRFYIYEKEKTFDMVINKPITDSVPQSIIKEGSSFVKSQTLILGLLAASVVMGVAVLVIGGDKMAPFVAVLVTTVMVLFFYKDFKNTLKK